MQFITLEDEHGLIEAFLPPAALTELQDPLTAAGPLLVAGRIEEDGPSIHLKVSEVKPFHLRQTPYRVAETV